MHDRADFTVPDLQVGEIVDRGDALREMKLRGHAFAYTRRVACAVAALAAGSLVAGCGGGASSGSSESSPAAVTSPAAMSPATAALRPIDRRALSSLHVSGANFACGHDIENEIRVPSSHDADALSAGLSPDRYFVRVAANAQGTGSLVIVEQHLVPTDAAILGMTRAMQALATKYHGTYDRWETQPVKHC